MNSNAAEQIWHDQVQGHRAVAADGCNAGTSPRPASAIRILLPAVIFYCIFLAVFAVFRAALCIVFYDTLRDAGNFLPVFPVGLRMDTVLLCYCLVLPVVCCSLLPAGWVKKSRCVLAGYFALLAGGFVFLEFATFSYMDEFSARPDRLFLENMFAGPEVAMMVIRGYPVMLGAAVAATAVSILTVYKVSAGLLAHQPAAALRTRIITFAVIAPLMFLGIRSSITHRPVNISDAAFSMNHLVNQLGISSTYSLAYALYQNLKHEQDPSDMYGRMPDEEVFRRAADLNGIAPGSIVPGEIPLLHHQPTSFERSRPLNLVIIIEESLGAEYVGCLGGMPLTPNLDRLSRDAVLFTRLYSTGTRTVRGIEAVISGFLPTPGESVVKLSKSRSNFFTIAELLRRKGYHTEFVYGGKGSWDNMNSFFAGNGFTALHDQDSFTNPVFQGSWGVSDEDLFNKTHALLLSHGEKPFFTLVLTTTNHDPFEFPAGRIEPYENAPESRYNAIKYADYALGQFFEKARSAPYYNNTLFLVIADHSTRLRGQELIPIEKFHIPALIIAPVLEPGIFDRLASQADMPATVLDIMGIACEHPMISRPLLSMPADLPGRAIMQYGETHAYRVEDRMIVQRPEQRPLQFSVKDDRHLEPAELDPEMQKDALAHALLPGMLYDDMLYRLPEARP